MKEKINKTNEIATSFIDIDNLSSEIKEETKKSLKAILGEAVRDYMKNSIINEASDEDENDSYDVEDVDDTDNTDTNSDEGSDEIKDSDAEIGDDEANADITDDSSDTEIEDADAESSDLDDSNTESGDEWSEFEKYKVSDDDYDLTGVEDDETVMKVYKLLNDDDQVVISKTDDYVHIKDNETDAEYVIELDPDEANSEADFDGSDDFSDSLDDDSMNESTDLGYTDNYQDTDPIANISMNEPANSSQTSSWDKGVPTGTKKPWAGKGNSDPFSDSITEENEDVVLGDTEGDGVVDEITTVTSNNARKMPKTHTSEPRKNNLPYGSKHISASGKYDDSVVEAILKKAKAIQEDNKQLKVLFKKVKTALQEAAVVNTSLGQIVKLITENTTTSQEKKNIIERFSDVSSVQESKALYETIKHELNKEQKPNVVLEKQMTTNGSKKINETPVYQSKAVMEMIDLMNRVNKL